MECPFCKKYIYGITGLIEVNKFRKHLTSCKKNPNRYVTREGEFETILVARASLKDALEIRAESGQ